MRHSRVLLAAAITAVTASEACGGGAADPSAPVLVFQGAAAQSLMSASGELAVAVRWSPAEPKVGYDAAELAITDLSGAAVAGLSLVVVPWMPAHGHGASVQPTVMETDPGTYVATPLDFFMAGGWELRTTIAGAVNDTVTPTVNVP
jgi:YtkA-like protein